MKKLVLSLFFLLFIVTVSAQTVGTLTVTFTPTTLSGSYSPKHVVAIYIRNSANTLVNTMLYYTSNGDRSAQELTTWWSSIGSAWVNRTLLTNVDALTGATSSAYSAVTCYWGKTVSLAAVADGNYTVNFEQADGKHAITTGTFTKGPTAQTVTPTNIVGFTNMRIVWTPVGTAVENVEMEKLYTIYPNPTNSSVFVNGNDIKEVEICTLAGKRVLVSNQQNINLSNLSKGFYLAVIRLKAGTVVKKIEKL